MRLINLLEQARTVSKEYINVPQPMVIYESEAELDEGEKSNPLLLVKIYNINDYFNFIKEFGLSYENKVWSLLDYNVWMKSTDKYVPENSPAITNGELTTYKKDENGQFIPYEGGWVKLYKLNCFYAKHYAYTSSGIWGLSLINYAISVAPKDQYSAVTRIDTSTDKVERHRILLEKLFKKKRPGAREVRMLHMMFNPMSKYFLQPEAAAKSVFKSEIKSREELAEFFKLPSMRKAIMRELSLLFDNFSLSVQKVLPAEDVANFLRKNIEKSVESETSEETEKRIKTIIEMVYTKEREFITNYTPSKGTLPPSPVVTEIPEGSKVKDILTEQETRNKMEEFGISESMVMDTNEESDDYSEISDELEEGAEGYIR